MLRKALEEVDLKRESNGGSVELFAADPADTTTLFAQKSVDAAATQEPWGYVLETQANGKLLLDWDEFAWGKESTNTVVAAREEYIKEKEKVQAYLEDHQKAIKYIEEKTEEAQQKDIDQIK